jgi:hypothetical protein
MPAYGYAPQSTNGLAIAALVLGILWLYWLGSILALVFGYVALSQIKRSGGQQSGRGMAIAGVVLGWIGAAVGALVLGIGLFFAVTFDEVNSDPSDGYCNSDRYVEDPDC